ncbi:hypothetical protein SAMN05216228_102745 [Rhizobium tibeticum]|uniref:Uncharacterized protein n=1 Tax=Rhizobium tibeticum TaxID=501024 RepID=A0A1H8T4M3_9HYPH|nr:hypothetical protein [Rhizobium tibeticum]SEI14267.1 hypothetical protein RTCCBAU85039_5062 [Rhizobium tibeticum]SEO85745.1 hypothetical protein SAMN05216228_102745 [Rhizobium tibeticum]
MDDDELAMIEAEYQGNDIFVVSNDPLIGRLELVADEGGVVEVRLDRATAEDLLSALVQFLDQGEGEDAPKFSTLQ